MQSLLNSSLGTGLYLRQGLHPAEEGLIDVKQRYRSSRTGGASRLLVNASARDRFRRGAESVGPGSRLRPRKSLGDRPNDGLASYNADFEVSDAGAVSGSEHVQASRKLNDSNRQYGERESFWQASFSGVKSSGSVGLLLIGLGLAMTSKGLLFPRPATAAPATTSTVSDELKATDVRAMKAKAEEEKAKREASRKAAEDVLRKSGRSVVLESLPELVEAEEHESIEWALVAAKKENDRHLLEKGELVKKRTVEVAAAERVVAAKQNAVEKAKAALKNAEEEKSAKKTSKAAKKKELEKAVAAAEAELREPERVLAEKREALEAVKVLEEPLLKANDQLQELWTSWQQEHEWRVRTGLKDERDTLRLTQELSSIKQHQQMRARLLQIAGDNFGVAVKGPRKTPPKVTFATPEEVENHLPRFRMEPPGGEKARKEATRKMVLGWRKWQLEQQERAKQRIRDDPELARKVAEDFRREVLETRDTVMLGCFFDEAEARWQMMTASANLAVNKNLVARARVRHDAGIMYLTLKGDPKEYFVDLRGYNDAYKENGGFQALYVGMQLSGVDTSVEVMWIPLDEWSLRKLFYAPLRMAVGCVHNVYEVLPPKVKTLYYDIAVGVMEETWLRFGEPFLPKSARVMLGYDYPDTPEGQAAEEAGEMTETMLWMEAAKERNLEERYDAAPFWWIYLPLRGAIITYPLMLLYAPLLKLAKFMFGPGDCTDEEIVERNKILDSGIRKGTNLRKLWAKFISKREGLKNSLKNAKKMRKPEYLLKDLLWMEGVKAEVREVLAFLRDPSKYEEAGVRPPRGVLIVGSTGTGKTTLAKAIAAEARVPVIEFTGKELIGRQWVGQGAGNIRELFKAARDMAPSIILFDDFDDFIGMRSEDPTKSGDQEHESLINQFLVEMDGFETEEGVVVLATASRPWAIDPAVRRPGRMDRTLLLPLPDVAAAEQILRKAANDMMPPRMLAAVDWAVVARKSAGLVPDQLKEIPLVIRSLCSYFGKEDEHELLNALWVAKIFTTLIPAPIRRTGPLLRLNERVLEWMDVAVSEEQVKEVVNKFDPTQGLVTIAELDKTDVIAPADIIPHAAWATGRALVAALLPNFDVVDGLWLENDSWEGVSFVRMTPRNSNFTDQEPRPVVRSYVEKQLVLCFGGCIGNRLLIDPTDCNNELDVKERQDAFQIAREMVQELGWGPDDSPAVTRVPGKGQLELGRKGREKIKEDIEKMYNTAYERAYTMITRNRAALDAIHNHLLKYKIVTAETLQELLQQHGAVFEEEPFRLFPYTRSQVIDVEAPPSAGKEKQMPASSMVR